MADDKTPDDKTTDDKSKSGLTAGTLRNLIREEIVKVLPGKKDESSTEDGDKPGSGASIKDEVAKALQLLQAKEKREARDKEIDDMLAKHKAPPEEKAPVERRRVEKFMRWE